MYCFDNIAKKFATKIVAMIITKFFAKVRTFCLMLQIMEQFCFKISDY